MKKTTNRGGFFRSLSYMTVSAVLFVLALFLTVFLLWTAVSTQGSVGTAEGIMGIAALLFAACGFVVPLYGHFIVRIDSKADWRIGAGLNGLLLLFLVFLYFLGIR